VEIRVLEAHFYPVITPVRVRELTDRQHKREEERLHEDEVFRARCECMLATTGRGEPIKALPKRHMRHKIHHQETPHLRDNLNHHPRQIVGILEYPQVIDYLRPKHQNTARIDQRENPTQ